MPPKSCIIALCLCGVVSSTCYLLYAAEPPTDERHQPPRISEQPTDLPGLHNVIVAKGEYVSGSEPHGEEAFKSLSELGIKTIVSVDGATPDLEMAKKYGMRYVHIPFGYDSVDKESRAALTRVAKDVKGPVYIHCHHGKHRGPAGAAILCQAAGLIDQEGGLDILERAGTSPKYKGLFRDVKEFEPLPDEVELPELVEVAKLGDMAAGMAILDRRFDNIEMIRDNGWKATAAHPDIDPKQEALLLRQAFRELSRTLENPQDREQFTLMKEAECHAEQLQAALEASNNDEATRQVELLTRSCTACHVQFRD